MKTGVYFCNCGTNISDKIDPERVRELLALPAGIRFQSVPFLCSEEGREFLARDLQQEGVERLVIGACSPREHEETFRRTLAAAGRNPFLLQMVNLREQIAWVCASPETAVRKAAVALGAALRRVALHEPLSGEELAVSPTTLVLGAGPAGLKAALTLAEAGRRVLLVEKKPGIGGLPVLYEELFPGLECGACLLEPLMDQVLHGRQAEHIELLTMADLIEVKGFFGNFLVKIRQRPRHVDPGRCLGCGECVEACPAGRAESDGAMRKAMGLLFPGVLPNVPWLDPGLCRREEADPECEACRTACPLGEDIIDLNAGERLIAEQVGAIIVATGAGLYDCGRFPDLGYGRRPDVRTAFELERLLASNGPTGGELRTAAGRPPRSVALIHCVGSLDEAHQPYCSGICCQYAFKHNHLLAAGHPELKIYHLFKELALPGLEGFKLRQEAERHPRSEFIRYAQLSELRVDSDQEGQRLELADGRRLAADLVVLCPAVVPATDSPGLAAELDIGLDEHGFFAPLQSRLATCSSTRRGIYLAGSCQAPGDIQRAAGQGAAAAGQVLAELVSGRQVELEPLFAAVEPARCSGCKVCLAVCPYRAIGFDEETRLAAINRVLCHGCGTCAAACPMEAITANHFTSAMILAEIEGALA